MHLKHECLMCCFVDFFVGLKPSCVSSRASWEPSKSIKGLPQYFVSGLRLYFHCLHESGVCGRGVLSA